LGASADRVTYSLDEQALSRVLDTFLLNWTSRKIYYEAEIIMEDRNGQGQLEQDVE
jgi:hypothetical protein